MYVHMERIWKIKIFISFRFFFYIFFISIKKKKSKTYACAVFLLLSVAIFTLKRGCISYVVQYLRMYVCVWCVCKQKVEKYIRKHVKCVTLEWFFKQRLQFEQNASLPANQPTSQLVCLATPPLTLNSDALSCIHSFSLWIL